MSERIQKYLAQQGIASRREIERWVTAGRIKVNGKLAELGCQVTPKDRISIDGRTIRVATKKQVTEVLLYHKPAGEICTRDDPEGRPTVFNKLPRPQTGRWIAIGRLDFNTSGLLIFTNNGELANQLMHPSSEIEREYAVRVFGAISPEILTKLQKGVRLEDGMAHFNSIADAGGRGSNHWYHVSLSEGRNREVRRLWESQGVTVSRLIRVRFGNVLLPKGLRQGQTVALNKQEIRQLQLLCQRKKINDT